MMLIQKISLVKAQYLSPYPLTSNILLSLCMQYVLLLCFNNKWKEQRNSRAVDWNNRTRTELEFETELNFDFSPSCRAKPKSSILQMLSLLHDECWVYRHRCSMMDSGFMSWYAGFIILDLTETKLYAVSELWMICRKQMRMRAFWSICVIELSNYVLHYF